MGQQHQVSFRQYTEGDFHCPRCKTIGRARYLAKGSGRWVKEGLFGDASSAQEDSAHSAAEALSRDAEVVKAYLKCPHCHMRAPGAFMWTQLTVGALLVLATVAWFEMGMDGKWGAMLAVGAAISVALTAFLRKGRADDATFSMIEKGELPKPEAKPKRAPLPRARIASGTAPKVVAAVPVIPVRTSAPQIVEARDAGDGPAFLK